MPKTDEFPCVLVPTEAINRKLTYSWTVNGDLVEVYAIFAASTDWAACQESRSPRWLARTLPGGFVLAIRVPERYVGDPGSLDLDEGLTDG